MLRRASLFALLAAMAAQAAPVPGLVASITDGTASVRVVTATPNFYLELGESLHPAIRPGFTAEWSGELTVLQAGAYTFRAGNASLSIRGVPYAGRPVTLGPGPHPIRIRYRRTTQTGSLRLEWQSNHFPFEPVPHSAFSHASETSPSGLAERGRELAVELRCTNCHWSSSSVLSSRAGPDLSDAGWRLNPAWVDRWLENPKAFRASSKMPGLSDASARRDIVEFLAAARPPRAQPRMRAPRPLDVAKGAELFGSIGCASCHRAADGTGLEGIGSKTQLYDLTQFLSDPKGRMPSMMLNGDEAFQIAAHLMESRDAAFEAAPPRGDAARGQEAMEAQGCIACHALPGMTNRKRAPALNAVDPLKGCLAAEPPASAAQYRLENADRGALREFVGSLRRHPDVAAAPIHQLGVTMRRQGCGNCHPDAAPPLEDIGAKLRTDWLARVVTGTDRSRKYLALRMPRYDARHTDGLEKALAKAAGVAPGNGSDAPPATAEQRDRGAGMIGTDPRKGGMGCVGCHDWGTYKSLGEEGPQLIDVADRLRHDWYARWMRNPGRILSGTSMPNYFSAMEAGRADSMIAALWAGMSLREKMPLPAGLGKVEASMDAEAHPVPDKEAIVVRWDMPEATPAAIAVGLPGGWSYCFDAGESRLRYAWRGGFVDLAETLFRKTDEKKMTPTAKIVGQIFYRSPSFPFRVGAPDRVPQRRFLGYRIVDGAPEFRYRIDGIEVTERIAAGPGGLTRTLTVGESTERVWFLEPAPRELPRGPVKFDAPLGGEAR